VKIVNASLFKAQCLSLLDEVNRTHEIIVVTKREVPIAKVVSVDAVVTGKKVSLYGSLLQ
jgi:prevent-host-death family protein